MKRSMYLVVVAVMAVGAVVGAADKSEKLKPLAEFPMKERVARYAPVRLTADISKLTANERKMISLLMQAAEQMDQIFWLEAWGDKAKLLGSIADAEARKYAEINYGPWDRLDDDKPFLAGVGVKPLTANFYPHDLTKEQFEQYVAKNPSEAAGLKSQYTVVVRDGAKLKAVPYHQHFAALTQTAAAKLRAATVLCEDAGLRKYLELRAKALETDEYRESDIAWLEMKTNTIDCVIGPIETYEDKLFGYKAAHESYVLIKDKEWSKRLERYAALLPDLQKGLPVAAPYKAEKPGTDSDLNAYDAVYYAGDCNAGAKTIAINLPNDEEVQLKKGTRRLQLKNAMRAKFDKILVPIADRLIASDQRKHITFDAFFGNTMFHEVAHGLGIKNTINGKGTVRESLKDQAGALEEGKADILGLYLVTQLVKRGEWKQATAMDHYVTFMAGIIRSVRFGAASAHGRANMACFNYFQQAGAFSVDSASGRYKVDAAKMEKAVEGLAGKILKYQGDGDYAGVKAWSEETGKISPPLQTALNDLAKANIPVDIVFEQGPAELGLGQ